MHAYLILTDNLELDISKALPNAEPPFTVHNFNRIKIEDIRRIRLLLGSGGKETCVIKFESFYFEAQNAFLKTLEEPAKDKTIILVTKSKTNLFDTILSRLQIVSYKEKHLDSKYSNFLQKDINERLSIVSKILELDHDDIKVESRNLVSQIINDKSISTKDRQTLAKMHDFLFEKGTSAKQILEFIAVTL